MTFLYWSLVFWSTRQIIIDTSTTASAVVFRKFDDPQDFTDGITNLTLKIGDKLTLFLIPFILKGVILKRYGKYFYNSENGIKNPDRFISMNFLEMILLIPVTGYLMIIRVATSLFRSFYLLGDMDKKFGCFDPLSYGWNGMIEAMRIRAEFDKKCFEKAKELRTRHRNTNVGKPNHTIPSSIPLVPQNVEFEIPVRHQHTKEEIIVIVLANIMDKLFI